MGFSGVFSGMDSTPATSPKLPDDVEALKLLLDQQAARNEQLMTENQHYKTQIASLTAWPESFA